MSGDFSFLMVGRRPTQLPLAPPMARGLKELAGLKKKTMSPSRYSVTGDRLYTLLLSTLFPAGPRQSFWLGLCSTLSTLNILGCNRVNGVNASSSEGGFIRNGISCP